MNRHNLVNRRNFLKSVVVVAAGGFTLGGCTSNSSVVNRMGTVAHDDLEVKIEEAVLNLGGVDVKSLVTNGYLAKDKQLADRFFDLAAIRLIADHGSDIEALARADAAIAITSDADDLNFFNRYATPYLRNIYPNFDNDQFSAAKARIIAQYSLQDRIGHDNLTLGSAAHGIWKILLPFNDFVQWKRHDTRWVPKEDETDPYMEAMKQKFEDDQIRYIERNRHLGVITDNQGVKSLHLNIDNVMGKVLDYLNHLDIANLYEGVKLNRIIMTVARSENVAKNDRLILEEYGRRLRTGLAWLENREAYNINRPAGAMDIANASAREFAACLITSRPYERKRFGEKHQEYRKTLKKSSATSYQESQAYTYVLVHYLTEVMDTRSEAVAFFLGGALKSAKYMLLGAGLFGSCSTGGSGVPAGQHAPTPHPG